MSRGYTITKLQQIGTDNYNTIAQYCDILLEEGYWEKPETVLKRSIDEILDLYIQAVLIQLGTYCECLNRDECNYIATIPSSNVIGMSTQADMLPETIVTAEKILNQPPILLQLCSLRDVEKSSSIAGLFFDALLNVSLSMAYLNNSNNIKIAEFILGYYRKVQAFLNTSNKLTYRIDERYIFRKISLEDLELSNAFLQSSNGDFNSYKKNYIYNHGKSKIQINKTETVTKEECTKTDMKQIEDEVVKTQDVLADLLDELHSLVGLEAVKTEISSLINLIKVRKLREKHNMPVMDMSYHMVYTGNPGTGKTTVARLVAKIYKELGVLSVGNLVETDRSGLVAGFVGQTAIKVKEVVEEAIGGVLFIDEAYSLANGIGTNDFGKEAIDTLVKMMEDNRENLVVIVAGYRDEMKEFLRANTGLVSRFNKFIDFKDYSNDELIQILLAMAKKSGYDIDEKSVTIIKEQLLKMDVHIKVDFGNARGIRNFFEKIVVNQANRLVNYDEPSKKQLTEILPEDVKDIMLLQQY